MENQLYVHIAKRMFGSIVLIALVSCFLALPPPASRAVNASQNFIIPGKSVGQLKLGDPGSRVLDLFPWDPKRDEQHTYAFCGPRTEYHWLDNDHLGSWGLFVYVRDDHIFQIESATPRFKTVGGITVNSPPQLVRVHYHTLRAFQLRYSAADVSGGRDLIYWVDLPQGIAFEFYFDRNQGERRVNRISTFLPGTQFLPGGCIVPPQEWIELAPYSLEPPNART
jgi:hypothetical protein